MRPVSKWSHGQNGVLVEYNPYVNAKSKLKENFGEEPNYYCSYCDRKIPGITLDVEHILPKGLSKYAHLKTKWDNFLLSCKSCNGVKLDADFNLSDVILPHIQNTLKCFLFNDDGTVYANSELSEIDLNKANKTIQLLGLDIGQGHTLRKPQDDRFAERKEVLQIAKRKLIQYELGTQDVDDILSLAKVSGFWAVWMIVFMKHTEVQKSLVSGFKGTYSDCLTQDINRINIAE